MAIPTKTPLASSLGGGVRSGGCRSRFFGLGLLVRPYSTSRGSGRLFRVLSSSSRSPLHRSFHRREAHSEAVTRRRRVAPGLGVLSGDLILRRAAP